MDWENLKWGFSKTSSLLGLSIIDHLLLGTPIYGKIQMRKKLGRFRSCAGIISLRAEAFYYTVFDLQAQQAPAAGRFLLCWATRSLDKFMGNPVFLQFCLQQVWICTSWIPETHGRFSRRIGKVKFTDKHIGMCRSCSLLEIGWTHVIIFGHFKRSY